LKLYYAVPLALAAVSAPAQDLAGAEALRALLERASRPIVTVKAVLKMEMGGQAGGFGGPQENRLTLQGVNVHSSGLIMLSNTPFSPKRMIEMMGGGGLSEMMGNMKATPTSIKVLIPGDEKEYDAFVGATDTNLDLLFVKIETTGAPAIPVVEFGGSAAPAIGDTVAMVSRLNRGFDFAPYFQLARVNGEIAKPRKAWTLDGSISQFGLPVYTTKGEPVGVLTTIPSGVKEEGSADAMGFAMLMRMLGGSGAGATGGAFVVPGAAVQGVVAQAVQKAETVAAERAKRKAAQPAKPPAKPATKPKP
jgi:hypothetical protein